MASVRTTPPSLRRHQSSGAVRFHDHPPPLQMDEPVVSAAEEHGVGQRRLAPVLPEDDVVNVALLGGPVTARADTAAVSRRYRAA